MLPDIVGIDQPNVCTALGSKLIILSPFSSRAICRIARQASNDSGLGAALFCNHFKMQVAPS